MREILRVKASPVATDLFMKVISRSRNVVRRDLYFRLGIIRRDYDDNKFTDCAFACNADFIVTNDSHFEDAVNSPFPVFRIINLDEFVGLIK